MLFFNSLAIESKAAIAPPISCPFAAAVCAVILALLIKRNLFNAGNIPKFNNANAANANNNPMNTKLVPVILSTFERVIIKSHLPIKLSKNCC